VVHFAAPVLYETKHFLERNTAALPDTLCGMPTTSDFVRQFLPAAPVCVCVYVCVCVCVCVCVSFARISELSLSLSLSVNVMLLHGVALSLTMQGCVDGQLQGGFGHRPVPPAGQPPHVPTLNPLCSPSFSFSLSLFLSLSLSLSLYLSVSSLGPHAYPSLHSRPPVLRCTVRALIPA
jgi:hypothetical protein